ncbi:MAG: protein kinase [Gemmataceae bacterium]|nr:protein kinase [Gemmataceae bacterium]
MKVALVPTVRPLLPPVLRLRCRPPFEQVSGRRRDSYFAGNRFAIAWGEKTYLSRRSASRVPKEVRMASCPTPEQWLDFHFGRLSEEALAPFREHLENCSACAGHLEQLDHQTDAVLNALRRPAPVRDSRAGNEHGGATVRTKPIGLGAPLNDVQSGSDARSALIRGGISKSIFDPPTRGGEAKSFAFLAPPSDPGELGWLAHYRVIKVLGQGGMGLVFQAEDTQLQRPVALKVLKPHLAQDFGSRQRFLREARAMAALRSDHIVTVYQVGQDRDVPYLAMELLQGETLDAWRRRGGPPTVPQLLRLARELAEALVVAHEHGLVHRDIKPGNIWLESESDRLKVLDFGLALASSQDQRLTSENTILGTPAYMAPEQAEGKPVDARCDLFSFGCVLYYVATGLSPFEGETTMAVLRALALKEPRPILRLNREVPADLSDLVMRLLSKDPAQRPASARAVLTALRAMDPSAKHTPPSLRRASLPRRRSWKPVLVGLVLLGMLGLGAGALWLNDQARSPSTPAVVRVAPTTSKQTVPEPLVVQSDEAWLKAATALRGAELVQAVRDRLKLLNSDFDGSWTPVVDSEGRVVEVVMNTEKVEHLRPLKALRDMTKLRIGGTKAQSMVSDLSQLEGTAIQELFVDNSRVADLKPLRKLPLRRLFVSRSPVEDLRPLEGLKLVDLDIGDTNVKDLSPLASMSLELLRFDRTKVDSLAATKDMPLKHVSCVFTSVDNLTPLAGKDLGFLNIQGTPVRSIVVLRKMPLINFNCRNTQVTDLAVLKDMPLQSLSCDYVPERDRGILNAIMSLRTINGQPVDKVLQ